MAFLPRHVSPVASTFTPQTLPPWSHSAGQLHHGLAPIQGALALGPGDPAFPLCPSNLLLLIS